MVIEVEKVAAQAIRDAVRERRWTITSCFQRLTDVGLVTSRSAVDRFLAGKTNGVTLDEWAAWALVLSAPPADLLAPSPDSGQAQARGSTPEQARAARRARAVREWLAGREPLAEVRDPERYRAAALRHTWTPSEFASTLRNLADAYDAADDGGDPRAVGHARGQVVMTVMGFALGTLRALTRLELPRADVVDDGLDVTDITYRVTTEEE